MSSPHHEVSYVCVSIIFPFYLIYKVEQLLLDAQQFKVTWICNVF